MDFGAHKVLISTSGNQCSSEGANIVACCTFSTAYRRIPLQGWQFLFRFFFTLPQFWLLVVPKTAVAGAGGWQGPPVLGSLFQT